MAKVAHRPAQDLTASLARAAQSLAFESLPADIVALAQQCLLDWLGVSIMGSREPLVDILVDEVIDRGGQGNCPIPGRQERFNVLDAAMVNGSAAHALDYDDSHRAGGHFTAPVASAVMALAYRTGANGRDAITAFIAGYETCARIGRLIQPDHYARGFHPTATLGSFGAAAASARLLNLDADRTEMALGIAGTQAAGLIANFGTMCKPFQVGRAAMNGLHAARLAQRGLTARAGILEHAHGFCGTHSADFHVARTAAEPDDDYHLRANVFKFHAACAGTHSTIDGLAAWRKAHGGPVEQIEHVTVRVNSGLDKVCNIACPKTGLEMKFSLRMTAAMALAGIDTSDPAVFTDDIANGAALTALRDRITVELTDAVAGSAVELVVNCTRGRQYTTGCEGNRPATDLDAQAHRLAAKFRSLAVPVIGDTRACTLIERFGRLQSEHGLRALIDFASRDPGQSDPLQRRAT